MAAPFIAIDSSDVSHLAVCKSTAGGCGWRGSTVRTRSKAQAQADEHRRDKHPSAAAKVKHRRGRRGRRGVLELVPAHAESAAA